MSGCILAFHKGDQGSIPPWTNYPFSQSHPSWVTKPSSNLLSFVCLPVCIQCDSHIRYLKLSDLVVLSHDESKSFPIFET